ncbi:putative zinc metalloproteinase-disintegrin agkistin isoform X1 [Apostichopus japonicus]|uniref:Putative zinc metalloproteinase-disintegrin agkistin isoform X1 n=1 Tax=Stichopus japonicus TaxID=307972 RepID=A0A2G8JNM1_STIJA|nr:putative zinc metalloproteinase-disintegrin agkistin isoform X1 [Apostichopus japonicus]
MTRFTLLACAILMFVLVCIHRATASCDTTIWKGCTLEDKQCSCTESQGCETPYQYNTMEECLDAVYGDVCKNNPCLNNGVCSQAKEHHYECKCCGTGYYGRHCEIECPADLTSIPSEKWNLGKACVKV